MKKQNLFKRLVRFVLIILAAVWMLFEDWVWDSIVAFMEVVGRLKIISPAANMIAPGDLNGPILD
jgi:hypothetical protein